MCLFVFLCFSSSKIEAVNFKKSLLVVRSNLKGDNLIRLKIRLRYEKAAAVGAFRAAAAAATSESPAPLGQSASQPADDRLIIAGQSFSCEPRDLRL